MPSDGTKQFADVWTRSRVRTPTWPRGTSGNGTKTIGSLLLYAQHKTVYMQGRLDYSDAVRQIRGLCLKDDQGTSAPILPIHETRQRPVRNSQRRWNLWCSPGFVLDRMETVANVVDFSKMSRRSFFFSKCVTHANFFSLVDQA